MSLATFVPSSIVAMIAASVVGDWIRSRAVTEREGMLREPFRVCQWGTLVSWPDEQPLLHFFVARLPSWRWERDMWSNKWCWHQLHVQWESCRGWYRYYLPGYARGLD